MLAVSFLPGVFFWPRRGLSLWCIYSPRRGLLFLMCLLSCVFVSLIWSSTLACFSVLRGSSVLGFFILGVVFRFGILFSSRRGSIPLVCFLSKVWYFVLGVVFRFSVFFCHGHCYYYILGMSFCLCRGRSLKHSSYFGHIPRFNS